MPSAVAASSFSTEPQNESTLPSPPITRSFADVPWNVKYAPQSLNDFIGNTTNIATINEWLKSWLNVSLDGRAVVSPPKGPMARRALIISGPPGIGKTTAVQLIAKKAGFLILEFNASDTRSKNLLHVLEICSCSLLLMPIRRTVFWVRRPHGISRRCLLLQRIAILQQLEGLLPLHPRSHNHSNLLMVVN
jgi:hypothetical protein